MEEKQGNGRGGCVAFAIVAIVLILPFLYAASIGPALWLYDHGLPVSADQLNAFYDPLRFICRDFQPLENLLEWWVRQWTDVAGA